MDNSGSNIKKKKNVFTLLTNWCRKEQNNNFEAEKAYPFYSFAGLIKDNNFHCFWHKHENEF